MTRGKAADRGSDLASPSNTIPSPSEDAIERPAGQINFEFLNFSHPSDAKASRARRTVRSHVTRQQHQKEQHAAAARRSRSLPQIAEASSTSRPPHFETHVSFSSTEASSESVPLRRMDSEAASSARSTTESPLQSPMITSPARIHPFDIYPPEWHASIPFIVDYCECVSDYIWTFCFHFKMRVYARRGRVRRLGSHAMS